MGRNRNNTEPWQHWLRSIWIAGYGDEGGVHRSLYQSEFGFLGIMSIFNDPKIKESSIPKRHNYITVDDVYFNSPIGARRGNYIAQIFDPIRTSAPLFQKRYDSMHDAELELAIRIFQVDEVSKQFSPDAWDAMGRYFDYDNEEWVVRPH